MRGSRKGIISLPIRLMLSFVIISLMVPPVMGLVDSIHEDMGAQELSSIAEGLRVQIDKVGSKSPGFRSIYEMDIPSGSHLEIGEEGLTIVLFIEDRKVGTVICNHTVVGDRTVLYGDTLLELVSTGDGVAVREL
jgi:hypothetical protein